MSDWQTALNDIKIKAAQERAIARSIERADKPARAPRAQRPIQIELHINVSAATKAKARLRGWAVLKCAGEKTKIYVKANRTASR